MIGKKIFFLLHRYVTKTRLYQVNMKKKNYFLIEYFQLIKKNAWFNSLLKKNCLTKKFPTCQQCCWFTNPSNLKKKLKTCTSICCLSKHTSDLSGTCSRFASNGSDGWKVPPFSCIFFLWIIPFWGAPGNDPFAEQGPFSSRRQIEPIWRGR